MRDWRALLWAACGALALVAGCKLDEKAFHAKVYTCNPSAADPACGTDIAGSPMACVPAHQLGGRDFCATACDRKNENPSGDGSSVCMAAGVESKSEGAELTRCNPTAPGDVCGNSELSCIRTDLRSDEGVCMTVNTCNSNAECRDPTRATCMGSLLRDTYGEKAELRTDHTYCLQTGCNARGAQCSPGESCLRKLLSRAARPPDICVPNCDANQNCPPNYFCLPGLYSKASPPVCIPGLPGFRCRSKLDCLVGDCQETGADFKICTVGCTNDDECAKLDSEQDTFICNKEKGHCVGARAFITGLCFSNDDCRAGEACGIFSADARDGNCLKTCTTPGASCPSFDGIPHLCVPQAKAGGSPVCLPTAFGNPCVSDAHCMGGLTCRRATPTSISGTCSIPCTADDECSKNRFTKGGFCHDTNGYCRPAYKDGELCNRGTQCESQSCVPRPGAGADVKECAKTVGW